MADTIKAATHFDTIRIPRFNRNIIFLFFLD